MMDSSSRIFIADSDQNILLTMADLLQREGYHCTPARDGFEACRALDTIEYDLLITEIQMPGNEEMELVWSARKHVPRMPVIISTGQPTLHSAMAAIELSVAAYKRTGTSPMIGGKRQPRRSWNSSLTVDRQMVTGRNSLEILR